MDTDSENHRGAMGQRAETATEGEAKKWEPTTEYAEYTEQGKTGRHIWWQENNPDSRRGQKETVEPLNPDSESELRTQPLNFELG